MPYLPNIPQPTDNLSDSQGQILGNFQQLQTSFSVNHVPLTTASNNGKHTFLQIPTRGAADTLPPGLALNDGNIYTNTVSSRTELYYSPDDSGQVYQLTRTSNSSYPSFATNANYTQVPPVPTQFGGWTFLPGGLLFQYGYESLPGSPNPNGIVKYPRAFSTAAYNVQVSLNANVSTSSANTIYTIGTPTTSQFQWGFTGSTSYNFFYWTAIGL